MKVEKIDHKYLFLFSIPAILSTMMGPIAQMVDTSFVGRSNLVWLAALGVAVSLLNSFHWVFNFLIHASTQSIADSFGKNSDEKIAQKIRISIMVAFILGVISSVIVYIFRFKIYDLAGGNASLVRYIDEYFLIRILGQPILLVFTASLAIITGLGELKKSFYLVFISTLFNVIFSWILFYSYNWGLAGIAWGTLLSQMIGLVISLIFITRYGNLKKYLFIWKFDRSDIFKFGKNSFHLFMRSFFLTMAFFLSVRFAGKIGNLQLAAHHLLLQFWLFSSFFVDGLAVTANVLIAREKSSKNLIRIRMIGRKLLLQGFLIGCFFSLFYFFARQALWSIFVIDQDVYPYLTEIWPIIILAAPILSLAYVADGILFGMEAFSYLKKVIIGGTLILFFPLALYGVYTRQLSFIWWGLFALGLPRLFFEVIYFYKRSMKENCHG